MSYVKLISSYHRLLLLIATIFVVGGCATINKVFPDPTPAYIPFVLFSDPENSGLLILSVDVYNDPSFELFSDNLIDKGLSNLLGTGKKTGYMKDLTVISEKGEEFTCRMVDGTGVFDGLPQGRYRIAAASAVFQLSNSERKEFFDCELIPVDDPYGFAGERYKNPGQCPYQAEVSFGVHESADSAIGPIEITNGQVKYVGELTIIENHKIGDFSIERTRINDTWHEVADHGHAIKTIIKAEPRPEIKKEIMHKLAKDNRENKWNSILQELDSEHSE